VPNAWTPFGSRAEFDFAHYHFVEAQSSAASIDKALDIWAATLLEFGGDAPWKNAKELYAAIDTIQYGDSPWKTYCIQYQGPRPPGTSPKWMTETYKLCTRDSRQVLQNQLATTQFEGKINLIPYRQFDGKGQRVWSNLMSGDWAWSQAVRTLFT
jgi:Plavaka transposase